MSLPEGERVMPMGLLAEVGHVRGQAAGQRRGDITCCDDCQVARRYYVQFPGNRGLRVYCEHMLSADLAIAADDQDEEARTT